MPHACRLITLNANRMPIANYNDKVNIQLGLCVNLVINMLIYTWYQHIQTILSMQLCVRRIQRK